VCASALSPPSVPPEPPRRGNIEITWLSPGRSDAAAEEEEEEEEAEGEGEDFREDFMRGVSEGRTRGRFLFNEPL